MATRISPERMRLFTEFLPLFFSALMKYPVYTDLNMQGVGIVSAGGATLRLGQNLHHGGHSYSDEFLSFRDHPAWQDPNTREGFADFIARELLESLLMGTD